MTAPTVGALVQRIDDRRIGRVSHVAVAGTRSRLPISYDGDVAVDMGYGSTIVTPGPVFWQRWRLFDASTLANEAALFALGEGST